MDYSASISQLPSTSLALLTSIIASHHLLIQVTPEDHKRVIKELETTASSTLGLTCALVTLTPETTLDAFTEAILIDELDTEDQRGFDNRRVATIAITASLDKASREVQLMALELMHTRRITGKGGVHLCPKNFCFVAVCESAAGLWPKFKSKHLNDFFWISHAAEPEEDEAASTKAPSIIVQDTASTHSSGESGASVVRKPPGVLPILSESAVEELRQRVKGVNATAEIRRYEHDMVTFMRLHRAVAGGVSAVSPRYIGQLTKILAVLNGINFVTPSIVALAARKVLAHRIVVATPDIERSMQWGSDRDAVEVALRGVTADTIVDEIISTVPAPL